MKGAINKGIQEFVETTAGVDAWNDIKEQAGCDEPFFAAGLDYDDELTLRLVQAAAEVTGLPIETVLVEFGKYWIPHTGRTSYPALFELLHGARECLLAMNRVHELVTRTTPNATPPQFEFDELPNGRLLMHYHSERRLCKVLIGLIHGVGELFDEELTVREVACFHDGSDHCVMEVEFP